MAGGGVGTSPGDAKSAIQKFDLFFGSLGKGEQRAITNLVQASLQGGHEVTGFAAGDEADDFALALTEENAPLLAKALGLPER
ncbi:MAG: hypothetical protein QOC92_4391 [Acidimicrobiaceae bacterium]|jgi:hypothetical protein